MGSLFLSFPAMTEVPCSLLMASLLTTELFATHILLRTRSVHPGVFLASSSVGGMRPSMQSHQVSMKGRGLPSAEPGNTGNIPGSKDLSESSHGTEMHCNKDVPCLYVENPS